MPEPEERPPTPETRCVDEICPHCHSKIQQPQDDIELLNEDPEPSTPTQASFPDIPAAESTRLTSSEPVPRSTEPPSTPARSSPAHNQLPPYSQRLANAGSYSTPERRPGPGSSISTVPPQVKENVRNAANVTVATCVVTGTSRGADAVQNCHLVAKRTRSTIVKLPAFRVILCLSFYLSPADKTRIHVAHEVLHFSRKHALQYLPL